MMKTGSHGKTNLGDTDLIPEIGLDGNFSSSHSFEVDIFRKTVEIDRHPQTTPNLPIPQPTPTRTVEEIFVDASVGSSLNQYV